MTNDPETRDPCCHHPMVPLPDRLPEGLERELVDGILGTLPSPGAVIEDIVFGDRFVALTAGGRMGLASLLGARPSEEEGDLPRRFVGRRVGEAAELLRSASPFSLSLGLAAVNAANTPAPDDAAAADAPAEALITGLGRGRTVGLVGYFPFVPALREVAGSFHLFELQDLAGAVPREQWDETLAVLDVLALTGTALLTRQMAYFLRGASRAVTVVLGPSTPLAPVLFDYGADYLCTSVVTDPVVVGEGIRAGLPFHAVKRRGGIRFVQWARGDR